MIEQETKKILNALYFPAFFVGAMWAIHIFGIIFSKQLNVYGIYPRHIEGLKGILFSPLIHGDFQHLISNSVPMLMLSFVTFLFYRRVAVVSIALIYVLTGFAVWLFAKSAYHIGASGVIYGLVSFVFWNGIFRRNMKSIILALCVVVLYSGYFLGIVPGEKGISWESHLFGALVGILISFVFKGVIEEDEKERPNPWAHEAFEGEKFFLQRDAFTMTKVERAEEARRIEMERREQARRTQMERMEQLRRARETNDNPFE